MPRHDLWRPERVVVTDVRGVNHLIYDTVLASATDGRYRAVCGATVLAAPLSTAEGADDCPLCRTGAHTSAPRRRRWPG